MRAYARASRRQRPLEESTELHAGMQPAVAKEHKRPHSRPPLACICQRRGRLRSCQRAPLRDGCPLVGLPPSPCQFRSRRPPSPAIAYTRDCSTRKSQLTVRSLSILDPPPCDASDLKAILCQCSEAMQRWVPRMVDRPGLWASACNSGYVAAAQSSRHWSRHELNCFEEQAGCTNEK